MNIGGDSKLTELRKCNFFVKQAASLPLRMFHFNIKYYYMYDFHYIEMTKTYILKLYLI